MIAGVEYVPNYMKFFAFFEVEVIDPEATATCTEEEAVAEAMECINKAKINSTDAKKNAEAAAAKEQFTKDYQKAQQEKYKNKHKKMFEEKAKGKQYQEGTAAIKALCIMLASAVISFIVIKALTIISLSIFGV